VHCACLPEAFVLMLRERLIIKEEAKAARAQNALTISLLL
jgi:hypothetical protein